MKPSKNLGAITAICLTLLFVSCLSSFASSPSDIGARESLYEVFSHGMKVGEVKTLCAPVLKDQGKAFQFESSMRINISFLFFSYNLDKQEQALVGEQGTFDYHRNTQENGKTIKVAGRLQNRVFRFTIDEDGEKRILVIPREKYDYTTLDCPEVTMGPGERERNLRILDLESLEIVSRKYRWVKDEDVAVDGRHIHCKVIDFQDANKKGRRWVEGDNLGVLVMRQDGSGKGITYSSRLISLAVKPNYGLQ